MPQNQLKKGLFYLRMLLDNNRYAVTRTRKKLPYLIFSSSCPLNNENPDVNIVYQENKLHNLNLAAAKLDGLEIGPGESFSFWKCVNHADRVIPFKKAFTDVDGETTLQYGGGLCTLSSLLYWLFLHTPVTVVERHGHTKRISPESSGHTVLGVDAIVDDGALDLKITNYSYYSLQLSIVIHDDTLYGAIYAEFEPGYTWNVFNRNLTYYQKYGSIYESVDVIRQVINEKGFCLSEMKLYKNVCEIAYPLPDGVKVLGSRDDLKND